MDGNKRFIKEVVIVGYVSECEPENNNYLGVVISTDDGDVFVEQNEKGEDLQYLIEHDLEIKGIMTYESQTGIRSIMVTDYELMDTDYGFFDEDKDEYYYH